MPAFKKTDGIEIYYRGLFASPLSATVARVSTADVLAGRDFAQMDQSLKTIAG